MKETSLDEFLDDNTDGSEPSASEESEPSISREPDPATAHWTPRGEACEACGDTVSRLWTDEGQRVCRDCKRW